MIWIIIIIAVFVAVKLIFDALIIGSSWSRHWRRDDCHVQDAETVARERKQCAISAAASVLTSRGLLVPVTCTGSRDVSPPMEHDSSPADRRRTAFKYFRVIVGVPRARTRPRRMWRTVGSLSGVWCLGCVAPLDHFQPADGAPTWDRVLGYNNTHSATTYTLWSLTRRVVLCRLGSRFTRFRHAKQRPSLKRCMNLFILVLFPAFASSLLGHCSKKKYLKSDRMVLELERSP